MASSAICRRLLNCCLNGADQDETMTVGSSSPIVRRVSPSKSRFSKLKERLLIFKRNNHAQEDNMAVERLPTFQQNLEQHNFAVAANQLICREESLFALNKKQEGMGTSESMLEDDETKLNKDFEDLFKKVMSTIKNSFDVETNEDIEFLKEAVLAIYQDEEQDRIWEEVAKNERPPWRPRCCRLAHDNLLQKMVTQRMEGAKLDSNVNIKSSVQLEITAKAKQLKEDLLKISNNVRSCYPKDNVCQLYAKIYHKVFSDKLREIADYGLADDDCTHVLQWVNNLYPEILRKGEISELIEYENLEPLLPDDILEQLEDQFLITKENELQTWCQTALNSEKSTNPELVDNCYVSHLSTDVIQCVHALLNTSKTLLGSWSKIQRITHQFKQFLINYQLFLENVIDDNQVNADAVLKANLLCITKIRNYIMMNPDPFPQHIRNDCIDLLTRTRDTCHSYFIKPIHKALKGTYSKLGTQEWIKHNEHVCSELLEGVDRHIQDFRNLHEAGLKELVSKLHEEVLAEYVRKMMKKKIKFKDENKQQQAAEALCRNSQKIHNLFTEAGSNMKDLEDILPKLAELLTLNDPQCIELQLVTLANVYPDLSEAHVSAWLHLKANLSTSHLKRIKKTFAIYHVQTAESTVDGQDPYHSCRNFFSKVLIK
ncbi:tumor necrosis factor alpha-induced protein 2 isoform X1 [Tachysurus vachellii]|uniref:tumor necrosis factor alpha-induced protein 2 isoform X1 n=2 Tax=Tachysurus vachellii TaxID=175792 RepID=UPI00296B5011|nr:tumor necrosis factor alpha-induced protein 2 isoform X1 [Tachysurus vachellii]